jgi:hypothetical protein
MVSPQRDESPFMGKLARGPELSRQQHAEDEPISDACCEHTVYRLQIHCCTSSSLSCCRIAFNWQFSGIQ